MLLTNGTPFQLVSPNARHSNKYTCTTITKEKPVASNGQRMCFSELYLHNDEPINPVWGQGYPHDRA